VPVETVAEPSGCHSKNNGTVGVREVGVSGRINDDVGNVAHRPI